MSQKRILVCPLNWGIGHATRMVPVIKQLIEAENEVIIAADKAPLAFLKQAFPKLHHIVFQGFEPQYSTGQTQVFKTLAQIPTMLRSSRADNNFVEKTVKELQIDAVISDNRFGAYSKQVPCVFISHQLYIQTPGILKLFNPIANRINHFYIRHFSECWVPDYGTEPSISGKLSHPTLKNVPVHYIGPLSRFSQQETTAEAHFNYDVLVMLSGPEPQRTLLEMKVIKEINGLPLKVCILRGKPGFDKKLQQTERLHIFNHAGDDQIRELIKSSRSIVSRPGYSTIMDLVVMNKRAFFVPTPGQTEQEYLATRMKQLGWFNSGKQQNFDIMYALESMKGFAPPRMPDSEDALRKKILSWLSSF